MICIDIAINGKHLCRAGIEQGLTLMPAPHFGMSSEAVATLRVAGMCELAPGRNAHVFWPDYALIPGDTLSFGLVEGDAPTAPGSIVATDSEAYLEEQRRFEEIDRNYVRPERPELRRWTTAAFRCALNGEACAMANMTAAERHLLCSLAWHRWSPGRVKVSLRSFGGAAGQKTQWLRADLRSGDLFEVHFTA